MTTETLLPTTEDIRTDIEEPELPEAAKVYGLSASYSVEDNKLRIRAERRMPREMYLRLKGRGYIWAPKQNLIVAPMWTPERHDILIELCGRIGDEDTTLEERSEQRADRFVGYQVNRTADGDRAYDKAQTIMGGIPSGQPILVGHHSQERAERDARRVERHLGTAVIMWERAEYWERRAAGVIRHKNYKERADVRARRIETIEAELRKQEREKAKAEDLLALWNHERMSDKLAYAIACRTWLTVHTDENGISYTAYDVLRPAEERTSRCPAMSWEQVREIARERYPARMAYAQRWINHCTLRIAYERAILAAQGGSHLLEKAPRPKQLPLLNYRAPAGLTVKNYGRMEQLPQVEMTAAEFKRIYSDYRGTRVVDGTHRVRFAILGEGRLDSRRYAVIFITDSKAHEQPTAANPPQENEGADEQAAEHADA